MTLKEAKERLRFIAEWWEPQYLKPGDLGCVVMVAFEDKTEDWPLRWLSVARAWDEGDQADVIRAIEKL